MFFGFPKDGKHEGRLNHCLGSKTSGLVRILFPKQAQMLRKHYYFTLALLPSPSISQASVQTDRRTDKHTDRMIAHKLKPSRLVLLGLSLTSCGTTMLMMTRTAINMRLMMATKCTDETKLTFADERVHSNYAYRAKSLSPVHGKTNPWDHPAAGPHSLQRGTLCNCRLQSRARVKMPNALNEHAASFLLCTIDGLTHSQAPKFLGGVRKVRRSKPIWCGWQGRETLLVDKDAQVVANWCARPNSFLSSFMA